MGLLQHVNKSNYFESQPNHIWLIQETLVAKESSIKTIYSEWQRKSFWSPKTVKQGENAILVSQSFTGEILKWKKDSNSRILSILFKIGETRINIINIYVPTNVTERKCSFTELSIFFFQNAPLIIVGDFNSIESDKDKYGINMTSV